MKKVMYKIGNVVSSSVGSLGNYFRALGDFTEKEIHVAETDFYLTEPGLKMPYESKVVFETSKTSDYPWYMFEPVFVVKDPRIDSIFGIIHIPNKVVIRKEERTYSTIQASEKGLIFRMYRLNKLRREVEVYPLGLAISKDTYYSPNPKMKPFVLTRTDEGNKIVFDYTFDSLKKSEYNRFTFDVKGLVREGEYRRVFEKEWYSLVKNSKKYELVLDLLADIPSLDFTSLHAGKHPTYFLSA